MALEGYQSFIYPVIEIFAFLAAVFAIKTLISIRKQKKDEDIKKILSVVFTLLALSFISAFLAEASWDFMDKVMKKDPTGSIIEIFWVIAYLLAISGFLYFGCSMAKANKKLGKGIAAVGTSAVFVSVLLYYIIASFIMPADIEWSFFTFLNFFYPIGSAVRLISSSFVYVYLKSLKVALPILLISLGIFCAFVGDMLYSYESWRNSYGVLGVIYDSLYAVEYMLAFLAFYIFSRKKSSEGAK